MHTDRSDACVMTAIEVESIERATIAAVSPAAVEERDGWLLPFDAGTIGRARSAVPLRHDRCDQLALGAIEARYIARGLPPSFRIAQVPSLAAVHAELGRKGYRSEKPTLVQIADCAAMRRVSRGEPADIAAMPDADWAAVFLGEGFDPVDGAHRVAALGRAKDAVYASVRDAGRTVAVGVAAFGYGWVGVHGMRTARARRGEGLAGRVLAGLAQAALARGVERVFLQVEEENAAARALYLRAGFAAAWLYRYWKPA